jgi:hypothetical protein
MHDEQGQHSDFGRVAADLLQLLASAINASVLSGLHSITS